MERANHARCPQHVTTERLNHLVKSEAHSSDVHRIGGVEQKEVVMGLSGWRRTGSTISHEAEVVGSLGEGVIALFTLPVTHVKREHK